MVEPPDMQTVAIAFSSDSFVMIWLGRRSSSSTFMTSSPAWRATSFRASATAGTMPDPIGVIPITSKALAIVFAVNCAPQAPAPGLAHPSSS